MYDNMWVLQSLRVLSWHSQKAQQWTLCKEPCFFAFTSFTHFIQGHVRAILLGTSLVCPDGNINVPDISLYCYIPLSLAYIASFRQFKIR